MLTNTQGVHRLRGTLASLLGWTSSGSACSTSRGLERVRPLHLGRRRAGGGARVAARGREDGAPAVHALGRPRLGPYGPAQLDDVRGAIDAGGKIVALDYTSWLQPLTNSNNAFETTYEQSGFGTIKTGQGGANTSIVGGPQYVIPNRGITSKSIPIGSGPCAERRHSSVAAGGVEGDVRVRADDRRARGRGEHGSGRVPARADERRPLAVGARLRRRRRRLAAEGGRVEGVDRERGHRTRRRAGAAGRARSRP